MWQYDKDPHLDTSDPSHQENTTLNPATYALLILTKSEYGWNVIKVRESSIGIIWIEMQIYHFAQCCCNLCLRWLNYFVTGLRFTDEM